MQTLLPPCPSCFINLIPQELIGSQIIAPFLPIKELIHCSEVSKNWYKICNHNDLWERHFPGASVACGEQGIKQFIISRKIVSSAGSNLEFAKILETYLQSIECDSQINVMIKCLFLHNAQATLTIEKSLENPRTIEIKMVKTVKEISLLFIKSVFPSFDVSEHKGIKNLVVVIFTINGAGKILKQHL